MLWPEVVTCAGFHSTFSSHRTHKDTAYTPRAAYRVPSFGSDVTFIAVGPRIIGLMPWRIIEILGKKEVRSGPREFGEVLSGVLAHT